MSQLKIRKNFEPHDPVGIAFPEQGRTKKSFKDECDINTIMARYAKTGQLPDLIKQNPQYGDFSQVADYQTSLNVVQHAEAQFAALDAPIRKRFDNDPAKFLAFAQDPKSGPEMVKLGLAKPRPSTVKSGAEAPAPLPAPQKGAKSTPSASKGKSAPESEE